MKKKVIYLAILSALTASSVAFSVTPLTPAPSALAPVTPSEKVIEETKEKLKKQKEDSILILENSRKVLPPERAEALARELGELDVCSNLDGTQNRVPPGRIKKGSECILELAVVDVCSNIAGNQQYTPPGMKNVGGICLPLTPTDVCPNIAGMQETVPAPLQLVNGLCVDIQVGETCKVGQLNVFWSDQNGINDCDGILPAMSGAIGAQAKILEPSSIYRSGSATFECTKGALSTGETVAYWKKVNGTCKQVSDCPAKVWNSYNSTLQYGCEVATYSESIGSHIYYQNHNYGCNGYLSAKCAHGEWEVEPAGTHSTISNDCEFSQAGNNLPYDVDWFFPQGAYSVLGIPAPEQTGSFPLEPVTDGAGFSGRKIKDDAGNFIELPRKNGEWTSNVTGSGFNPSNLVYNGHWFPARQNEYGDAIATGRVAAFVCEGGVIRFDQVEEKRKSGCDTRTGRIEWTTTTHDANNNPVSSRTCSINSATLFAGVGQARLYTSDDGRGSVSINCTGNDTYELVEDTKVCR